MDGRNASSASFNKICIINTLKSSTVTEEEKVKACGEICTHICLSSESVVRAFDVSSFSSVLISVLESTKYMVNSMLCLMVTRGIATILDQVPRSYFPMISHKVVSALCKLIDSGALHYAPTGDEVLKALTALSLDAPSDLLQSDGVRLLLEKCFCSEGNFSEHLQSRVLVIVLNCFAKARQDTHHTLILPCVKLLITLLTSQQSPDKISSQVLQCLSVYIDRCGKSSSAFDEVLRLNIIPHALASVTTPSTFEGFCALIMAAFSWSPAKTLHILLESHAFEKIATHLRDITANGPEQLFRFWHYVLCHFLPPLRSTGVSTCTTTQHISLHAHVDIRNFTYSWSWEDDFHNLIYFENMTSLILEAVYKTCDHSGVAVPHIGSFSAIFYFTDMMQVARDHSVSRRLHRSIVPRRAHLRTKQPSEASKNIICLCPVAAPLSPTISLSPTATQASNNNNNNNNASVSFTCCGMFLSAAPPAVVEDPVPASPTTVAKKAKHAPRGHAPPPSAQVASDIVLANPWLCEDVTISTLLSEAVCDSIWSHRDSHSVVLHTILPHVVSDLERTTSTSIYRDGLYIVATCLELMREGASPIDREDGIIKPLEGILRRVLVLVCRALNYCCRRLHGLLVHHTSASSNTSNATQETSPRATVLRTKFVSSLTEDGQLFVCACTILNHLTCGLTPPSLGTALRVTDTMATLKRVQTALHGLPAYYSVPGAETEREGLRTMTTPSSPCKLHPTREHMAHLLAELLEVTVFNTLLQCPEEEEPESPFYDDEHHAKLVPPLEVFRELTRTLDDRDICVASLFDSTCNIIPLLSSLFQGHTKEETALMMGGGSTWTRAKTPLWGQAMDSLFTLTPVHVPYGLQSSVCPLDTVLGVVHERLSRLITLRFTVLTTQGDKTTVFTHQVVSWASLGIVIHYLLTSTTTPPEVRLALSEDLDLDISIDNHSVSSKAMTVFECLLLYAPYFLPLRRILQTRPKDTTQASMIAWRTCIVQTFSALNNIHNITIRQRSLTPSVVFSTTDNPPQNNLSPRYFFEQRTETFLSLFRAFDDDLVRHENPHVCSLLSYFALAPSIIGPVALERLCCSVIEEQRFLTIASLFPALVSSMTLSAADLIPSFEHSPTLHILRKYPSLFPLPTRLKMLQNLNSHDNYFSRLHFAAVTKAALGFDTKRSVHVRRSHMAEDCLRVLRLYGPCAFPLDVAFEGEAGSGTGVTTEFYTLAVMEVLSPSLGLWRSGSGQGNNNQGYYPAPCKSGDTVLQWWYIVGILLGRSLREKRVLPWFLHRHLFTLLRGHQAILLADPSYSLSEIDHELEHHLCYIERIKEESFLHSLMLDFTDLCTENPSKSVTIENVSEYTKLRREHVLVSGVRPAISTLLKGLQDVVGLESLDLFTSLELQELLCGNRKTVLWASEADVWGDLMTGHGYDLNSPQVEGLVRCVASFGAEQQRQFLMFVSGAFDKPLQGLHPKLTIVRKDVDETMDPDSVLPTVNTCFHYLKIPMYSSVAVLMDKLVCAITHGMQGFLLS